MRLPDVAPLLKGARRAYKLSQAELAEPLGMSRATISALESVGLEVTIAPRKGRPTLDDLRAERRP
jgi:DNA-binding XRE family transcriptional regulator